MRTLLITKSKIAAMTMTVLLSACTMEPTYQRPVAPMASAFPTAAPSSAESKASEMPWHQFCRDERLNALVDLALTNNRDLQVAMLKVEQSRAQYRITRAGSLPNVDGSVGFARQNAQNVTTSQWNANAGVTGYELDLFGRLHSLNKQALEQYFATEETRNSARISLVAEVATQYFSLRQVEEQLMVARETLSAVQQSFKLNKISFEAGQSNELDLRTAEGQVQSTMITIRGYELEQAQTTNALELLIGQSLPADLPASRQLDADDVLAMIPVGLPADLLDRRPDILAAEHSLKSANANIGAARAAFFPSISLTGSIGSASTELSGLFGAGTGTWRFSPQLSIPIFSGGRNRANLDAAKISTQIQVANYQKAIQTAFREVADALAARSSYAEQIGLQSTAIIAQRRRLELATLRYRQGEDSYLNVLLAQQDLQNAQQGLLRAQFNKLTSTIALYKALGGGWR